MQRRAFLVALPCSALPAAEAGSKQTYTFKKAGSLEIQADVYRPAAEGLAPAIFWIHGGALIMGHRENIRPWQLQRYLEAGFAVVSVDYRLAPEVKLAAILSDVEDAWRWLQREGRKRLGIDSGRVAVVGHSAGGYLTLCSGYRCRPRPRALVSFYGYGDIAADWYSKPDPFYLKQPAVSKEEAYGTVGGAAIAGTVGAHRRGRFYLYCRQQGLWPLEVAGIDPRTSPKAFDPFCPARNITGEYPPTLLLHGDQDTDVPFSQSEQMAAELERHGVRHELIRITGGPHGFDSRREDPQTVTAFEKVLRFLQAETGRDRRR